MAEIGLIASVVQVAGAGLKLSQTLYHYADGVASADRRIKDIANEIELTSSVIEELGALFRNDESSGLLSKNALKTADKTVRECSSVFTELDVALTKSKKNKLGRLMLPFRESKIELLRSHIDKLKSTLQLLMQVLTHAHQIAAQKLDREAEAAQREQIKALLQNKKTSTKRYEESLRNYSMTEDSTLFGADDPDSEVEELRTENNILMATASIGSSITPKTLEKCVEYIQRLLDDIDTLQKALSKEEDGLDHSGHHQRLTGSYFRARRHLDGMFLGNPGSLNAGRDNVPGTSPSSWNSFQGVPETVKSTNTDPPVNKADTAAPSSGLIQTFDASERPRFSGTFLQEKVPDQRGSDRMDISDSDADDEFERVPIVENLTTYDTRASHKSVVATFNQEKTSSPVDPTITEGDLEKATRLAIERTRSEEREENAKEASGTFKKKSMKRKNVRRLSLRREEATGRIYKTEVMRKKAAEEEAKLKAFQDVEDQEKAKVMAVKEKAEAEEKARLEFERRVQEEVAKRVAEEGKNVVGEHQSPVKFEDAIGRKFSFPFHTCNTWKSIEKLIQQAFFNVEGLSEAVSKNQYDLMNEEGETILPFYWDSVIQPGHFISMKMRTSLDAPVNKFIPPPPAEELERQLSPGPGLGAYVDSPSEPESSALPDDATSRSRMHPVTHTDVHHSREEEKVEGGNTSFLGTTPPQGYEDEVEPGAGMSVPLLVGTPEDEPERRRGAAEIFAEIFASHPRTREACRLRLADASMDSSGLEVSTADEDAWEYIGPAPASSIYNLDQVRETIDEPDNEKPMGSTHAPSPPPPPDTDDSRISKLEKLLLEKQEVDNGDQDKTSHVPPAIPTPSDKATLTRLEQLIANLEAQRQVQKEKGEKPSHIGSRSAGPSALPGLPQEGTKDVRGKLEATVEDFDESLPPPPDRPSSHLENKSAGLGSLLVEQQSAKIKEQEAAVKAHEKYEMAASMREKRFQVPRPRAQATPLRLMRASYRYPHVVDSVDDSDVDVSYNKDDSDTESEREVDELLREWTNVLS